MFTTNGITLLNRDEIDLSAWDQCIDEAPNGLPYAYSWYLDIVCNKHWQGVIIGNYRAVCPLPYNRKLLGYPQIYQPILSQQGGVFGLYTAEELLLIISTASRNFRRININLNAENHTALSATSVVLSRKTNLTLALDQDYATLNSNYAKSLRKRLRKATAQLSITAETDRRTIATLVSIYREQIGSRLGWKEENYTTVSALITEALGRKKGFIRNVMDESGDLVCSGFFLHSHGRIINLFGASTLVGKEKYGMHFLLDSIIRAYAGKKMIFDFEGSEIPGVAEFFRSFGAVNDDYGVFSHDSLPAWLTKLEALKQYLAK